MYQRNILKKGGTIIDIKLLKEQIYYQIQLVNKSLYTNFEFCVGSSPSRTEILKYLYENGKVTQSELQKGINIDRAAITRHLQQLESLNYIERFKESSNQRVTWVKLAISTQKEIENLFRLRNQFVDGVLADFTYEQLTDFYEMLNVIEANLSKTMKE